MIPKADAVYLDFRHTSVDTATVLFTLPTDSYCSPLPHKTHIFSCVFVEQGALNNCVACILLMNVHGATLPIAHLSILIVMWSELT